MEPMSDYEFLLRAANYGATGEGQYSNAARNAVNSVAERIGLSAMAALEIAKKRVSRLNLDEISRTADERSESL